jgi:methyltransferase, FkbM family
MTQPSHPRLATVLARTLLRIRERFFPRTQFAKLPVVGALIPLLLRRARSSVVESVDGHRMFVDERDSMGLSIDPVFEPLETEFCRAVVRPGAVVVDIGANIGYYTLIFARQVGPSGKVIAFEPDADNFRLLGAKRRREPLHQRHADAGRDFERQRAARALSQRREPHGSPDL